MAGGEGGRGRIYPLFAWPERVAAAAVSHAKFDLGQLAPDSARQDSKLREPITKPMAAKILSDIMTRHVDTVAPGCLLSTAAWIMKDDRLSSLVVVAEGKAIGILTERDIVRAMHQGCDYDLPVSELMGAPLVTAGANMEFHAAVRLACERGIRHLVVVDGDGAPLGICTATDFRFHLNHGFFARHRLEEAADLEPVFVSPQALVGDVVDRLMARGQPAAIVVEGRRAVGTVSGGPWSGPLLWAWGRKRPCTGAWRRRCGWRPRPACSTPPV